MRAGGAADKKHASRDESSLGCWSCFCEVDICVCLSTDRAAIYKPISGLVADVPLNVDKTCQMFSVPVHLIEKKGSLFINLFIYAPVIFI